MTNISVVMMAKNAEVTIDECLSSLTRFEEVILYLNNSTDNTSLISQKYKNVKIVDGEFVGFGPTKNLAGESAKNDWILSLDTDEILNDDLINEIANIDVNDKNNIFVIKRDNYFLGYKTVSRDFVVRIYNRTTTKFTDAKVHEKVIENSNSKKINLKNTIKHLNITDINQTLYKTIQYTDLGAKNKKTCFFTIVILKSIYAFFQTYILRGYIINGWVGFTIAITSANRRFYKYLKQFVNCKNI